MNQPKRARSSLFLMELILAILFFSLGSAVCVQAFAKAHLTSQAAQDLSFASSTVSSAASVIKYTGGTLADLQTYFPNATEKNLGHFAVYYDAQYTPCSPEHARYSLHINTSWDTSAETAHIWMEGPSNDLIYEVRLRYLPQRKEAV